VLIAAEQAFFEASAGDRSQVSVQVPLVAQRGFQFAGARKERRAKWRRV